MQKIKYLLLAAVIAAASSCTQKDKQIIAFGTVDGKDVQLFILKNNKGDEVRISNYGATITHWISRDVTGKPSSIVLGFDSLPPYLQQKFYCGGMVGRYASLISKGRFCIDSTWYQLDKNYGNHSMNGGNKGFDKVVWYVDAVTNNNIILTYKSPDGDQGYPGNVIVKVAYMLSDNNELFISYLAKTDKPTFINLAQHPYFNLTGGPKQTILNHSLLINAPDYTPVDTAGIPTDSIANVLNTPFDFTKPHIIGEQIRQLPGGYDHNYALKGGASPFPRLAATLTEETSGRKLEIFTELPGLQVCSADFFDGQFFDKHTGLCLQTQYFPNSPNQSRFPNTLVRPGRNYHSVTIYKLSLTRKN